MRPRHAEAHRGRHLLPAMASLAGEVGDLVHVGSRCRHARPGVQVNGTRGLGSSGKRREDSGKRATRMKAPGLCASVLTDGAARRQ